MAEETVAPEAGTEEAQVDAVDSMVEGGETGFLENDPLSSLFETPPPEETVKEDEAVTASAEDKTGEKQEEAAPPAEETQKEEPKQKEASGWEKAYFAERARRQKLEKSQSQTQEPQKTEFDWKDPSNTIDKLRSDLKFESDLRFADLSQQLCRGRHEDFDEKYQVFEQMATANPALLSEIMSKPDPAQHAYDLATQKMFQDQVGADPEAYEKKLEAKIRAEVEAEFKNKAKATGDLAASLPPSAASLTDKVPINSAPKDALDELFPGQIQS